jgi:hypothetical protein
MNLWRWLVAWSGLMVLGVAGWICRAPSETVVCRGLTNDSLDFCSLDLFSRLCEGLFVIAFIWSVGVVLIISFMTLRSRTMIDASDDAGS